MTQTAQTRQPRTVTGQSMMPAPAPVESHGQRGRRMIAEMSNVRTLQWIGIALAAHVLVIGLTSIGYITQCIKQGTIAPRDEAQAAAPAATAPTPAPAAAPVTPAAATPTAAPAATAKPEMSEDEKRLAELKKSGNPEAKKLTETAAPSELPKGPAHGFKISEDP